MWVSEDRASSQSCFISSVQPIGEPVGDGVGHRIAAWRNGQSIFVVSQDLSKFGLSGGFGDAATAFDDPLSIGAIAKAGGGNPPLPSLLCGSLPESYH